MASSAHSGSPPILRMATELLDKTFQSLDNIDDALHLGRACSRMYAILDGNRLSIMRSIIIRSKHHDNDIALCQFIDAYQAFASVHLVQPLNPDRPIPRDAHPELQSFWDIAGPWCSDCLKDNLNDQQVWEAATRWHVLKIFAKLYANPTINASFRASRGNGLNYCFRSTELNESARMEWRSAYHRSCVHCVTPEKRWKDEVTPTPRWDRYNQPCQHAADDLKYTYNNAVSLIEVGQLDESRVYETVVRHWMFLEADRYLKICRAQEPKSKSDTDDWLFAQSRIHKYGLQAMLDTADISDFIQTFLLGHAEFASAAKWQRWTHGIEFDFYREEGGFARSSQDQESSFTSNTEAYISPADVLDLIIVSDNRVRARNLSLQWTAQEKAKYLRLRSISLSPDQLASLFHPEDEGRHKIRQIYSEPNERIMYAGWMVADYVPTHHVPVRRLWNDFARNGWNASFHGRALFISQKYWRVMPYLIQNTLLGGDVLGTVTEDQARDRLQLVDARFQHAEELGQYYSDVTESESDESEEEDKILVS